MVAFVGILLIGVACVGSQNVTPVAPSPEASSTPRGPQVGVKEGDLAPDFVFSDVFNEADLGSATQLSDLRGKVVLINFWASWCRYCDAEMPSLQAFYERYSQDGFVIIGLNDGEDRGTAVGYIQKKNLTFPIVLDESKDVTRMYRVTGIPTSFLIDKNGVIVSVVIGARDWNDSVVHHAIELLLEK